MATLIEGFEKASPEQVSGAKGKLSMMAERAAQRSKEKGGFKSVRVDPKKKTIMKDENSATVFVEEVFGDGSVEPGEMRLVKENGKWKVKL